MSLGKVLISSQGYFAEVVEEACNKRKVQAPAAAKNYLVNILEHYLDARNLFETDINEVTGKKTDYTLAELYLLAHQAETSERQGLLKKLGDRSLYISGYFGDSLNRKIVDLDYYKDMGEAAYAGLADCVREDTVAQVYKIFSARFLDFVEVLTYISQQSMVQTDENILRLYDRYMKTGSDLAREKLIEIGVLTVPLDQAKFSKQD
jgi:hypothetical protein